MLFPSIHPKYSKVIHHRDVHTSVFMLFIHNSREIELGKLSINRGMGKENVLHIHKGVLGGCEEK